MSKIRHTIDGYDVDWLVGGDNDEAISYSRNKEKLREDISRIDEMRENDLTELDDRVFKALSNTVASIEAFREKSQRISPDEEDLDWFRRAEYSRLSFVRARKLIHRRRVILAHEAKKQEKMKKKEEGYLNFLKEAEVAAKKQEEKTRRFELQAQAAAQKARAKQAAAEKSKADQEERIKRHHLMMELNLSVEKTVILLIRSRGILTEEEIFQLYREAEAIVSAKISEKDDANG